MTSKRKLNQDGLKDRVVTEIRNRWLNMSNTELPANPVLSEQHGVVARTALDAMLTRRFRVTKLPDAEEYDLLLDRVTHWVSRNEPIRITLGYAPMKNQNAVDYSHCDWSEFFALCHLAAWNRKVQAVYSPGLTVRLVFDDSSVLLANGTARSYMDEYIQSVRKLIRAMRYERLIVGIVRHSSFSWLFRFGLLQLARRKVRQWEQQPENQQQIQTMAEYARRNLLAPSQLGVEDETTRCLEASHRYRVYFEALRMSGVTRIGKNIVAMYMDGAQHHVPFRPALHLATLHKEMVTQPWQGAGALQDNGRGRLVPYVMTASRLGKYASENVQLPELVGLPGFHQIQVVDESRSGHTGDAESVSPQKAA